jgi:hypothetical protein
LCLTLASYMPVHAVPRLPPRAAALQLRPLRPNKTSRSGAEWARKGRIRDPTFKRDAQLFRESSRRSQRAMRSKPHHCGYGDRGPSAIHNRLFLTFFGFGSCRCDGSGRELGEKCRKKRAGTIPQATTVVSCGESLRGKPRRRDGDFRRFWNTATAVAPHTSSGTGFPPHFLRVLQALLELVGWDKPTECLRLTE